MNKKEIIGNEENMVFIWSFKLEPNSSFIRHAKFSGNDEKRIQQILTILYGKPVYELQSRLMTRSELLKSMRV